MMSGGLDRVSRMKVTAALVLRFCISTLLPGYFFWNACAKGSVTSLENDVITTRRSSMAWAKAGGARVVDDAASDRAPAIMRRRETGMRGARRADVMRISSGTERQCRPLR